MIYISKYLDIICFENPTLLIYEKNNKERSIYLKENALSIYASLRMKDKISMVEFFLRLKNLSIQQIFEVLKSSSKDLHLFEDEKEASYQLCQNPIKQKRTWLIYLKSVFFLKILHQRTF